jgi:hypothetical protein
MGRWVNSLAARDPVKERAKANTGALRLRQAQDQNDKFSPLAQRQLVLAQLRCLASESRLFLPLQDHLEADSASGGWLAWVVWSRR